MNESENTFKVLANQPLLTTSIWCKFGFHKWQKWSDPYKSEGYSPKTYQKRFCDSCNIVQRNPVDL